ncbi:hypothetical protein RJ640_003366, partial [Escallonia rubra]
CGWIVQIPVVRYIFSSSLKLKSSDAETVINLHNAAEKFVSLIPLVLSNEDMQNAEVNWKRDIVDAPISSKLRIQAGLLLRDIKDFWRAALLLSTLLYPSELECPTRSAIEHFELDKRREIIMMIEKEVLTLGLEKVWEMKPLVNGKDIMSVLQLKTGGPLVSEWKQKLLEWQLAHPSASAGECIDWMKQTHSKRAKTE